MMPGRAGWFLLARLGATLLAGALVGWMLGRVAIGVMLALAAMLAWQLLNLYWLDYWLKDRSGRDPPDSSGLWGEVVSRVVRLHRRKRFHKQRLLDVFRELRHSTAAMPDGVIILNSQWEILWFNRMAGKLLDLRRKADLGLRIIHLIRDPALVRYLDRNEFHEPLVVARGTELRTHLSLQVVPYSGTQRLMLVRDVSRQVALESMRQDFVANASHELRSPLTVITGYLETLLADDALDQPLRGPLREMQRQSQRMNSIVNDLLDLSRLDATSEEAANQVVDVAAMCAVLRKDVLARPQHPAVSLKVASDAKLSGDESELLSAFSNLVDNAAKYTPATAAITIGWYLQDSGHARFEVQDTGPGIAPEHLPRLTERFYRVDAGRSREAGGAGLGLAIVKHVLQHHGAELEVRSEPGTGSTFTCVFPPRRVLTGERGDTIANHSQSAAGAAPENIDGNGGSLSPHIAALQ
jgi:two-component system, OmpR family, phosphate regulon sensor histidine kinase PhoR